MYEVLGIISAVLFVIVMMPFLLRHFNRIFFKGKNRMIASWRMWFRKIHKPAGCGLAVISLVHGYLALGSIRLHTGTLAWIVSIAAVILGVFFSIKKKAVYLVWHRRAALLAILFIALHLLVPGALYYIGF
nr:hypothetical protein [uncultured Clostridium sp.]